MKAAFLWLFSAPMKRSTFGCIASLVLAFLSMGMTGLLLFLLVTPALNLLLGLNLPMNFSGIDQLRSERLGADALWPTIILVSMLWSFGFLLAGFVNYKTRLSQFSGALKTFFYVAILWAWALLLWIFAIKVGFVQ